jgi:hypothetical protein
VLSSLLVIVLIQVWPSAYQWGPVVSWTREEETGRFAYRIRFGLKPAESPLRRRIRKWRRAARHVRLVPRRYGPFDIEIHARVAVSGLTSGDPEIETIVEIPVDRDWRPAVSAGGLTRLRPEYCDPFDLRSFPREIRDRRTAERLNLHDLLALKGSTLRLYAFASRPYIGTRLVGRGSYKLNDITAGRYMKDRFERATNGAPPAVPAAPIPRKFLALGALAEASGARDAREQRPPYASR